jgi:hypothetical protein
VEKQEFTTSEELKLAPGDFQTRTYSSKAGVQSIAVESRNGIWQPNMEKPGNQETKVGPKSTPVEITYQRVSKDTVRIELVRKYL